ncbi:MAG: hypothetical protein ABIN08_17920 [Caldimonas sp.]
MELQGVDHIPWGDDADRIADEVEDFLTGAKRGAEPDRVLATVLFSDIVGATEKAASLGNRRWHDLLDSHHALIRSELLRFRGREIDNAGDGFLATFDGPARDEAAATRRSLCPPIPECNCHADPDSRVRFFVVQHRTSRSDSHADRQWRRNGHTAQSHSCHERTVVDSGFQRQASDWVPSLKSRRPNDSSSEVSIYP